MLKIILITLFVLPTIALSQIKIEGTYSYLAPNQEHYDFYDFAKSGKFEYHTGASGGDFLYGKGIFKISGDTLILNYNSTELQDFSGYHRLTSWKNNRDSIDIQIQVMDTKGIQLRNGFIFLPHKKRSADLNKEGSTFLKFEKTDEKIPFEITSLGYQDYFFDLEQNLNQSVVVFLQENQSGIPIKGQKEILIIKNLKKDFIELEDSQGRIWIKN